MRVGTLLTTVAAVLVWHSLAVVHARVIAETAGTATPHAGIKLAQQQEVPAVPGQPPAPAVPELPAVDKAQDRLPSLGAAPEAQPAAEPAAPAQPPAPGAEAPAEVGAENPEDPEGVLPNLESDAVEDEFSVGEIPEVQTVELTAETAKAALDAYVMVREKYKDAELENYENLQDFVDQTPEGKAFEADIKAFKFNTVDEWNVAITMVGFAYSNILDDQTADIKAQVAEINQDTEMAADMRERMVKALEAMIPSDNNRKVVQEMIKDPVYAEKIKQLENEEE